MLGNWLSGFENLCFPERASRSETPDTDRPPDGVARRFDDTITSRARPALEDTVLEADHAGCEGSGFTALCVSCSEADHAEGTETTAVLPELELTPEQDLSNLRPQPAEPVRLVTEQSINLALDELRDHPDIRPGQGEALWGQDRAEGGVSLSGAGRQTSGQSESSCSVSWSSAGSGCASPRPDSLESPVASPEVSFEAKENPQSKERNKASKAKTRSAAKKPKSSPISEGGSNSQLTEARVKASIASADVKVKVRRNETLDSLSSHSSTTFASSSTSQHELAPPMARRRNRRTDTNCSIASLHSVSSLPSVKEDQVTETEGDQTPINRAPARKSSNGILGFLGGRSTEPTAPDNAVIIFDWDDTLCPTSWAMELLRVAKSDSDLKRLEQTHAEELEKHCAAVVQMLRQARSVARVAIVTLATPEFWQQSAESFLEPLNVKELFPELGIQVYHAIRPNNCKNKQEAETVAKRKAMKKCLSHFYPAVSARHVRWNVLSIGDSAIEQDALKQLLSERSSGPLCKTLKFTSTPTLEQLTRQVQSVTPFLEEMVADSTDFDRTSFRPWKNKRPSSLSSMSS